MKYILPALFLLPVSLTAQSLNSTVPNDTHYNDQWALKNNGSFNLSTAKAGADIEMEPAWNIEQGDTSIIVAIIDTGCKLDHPDLGGRIWINYKEIANNSIDDDNNGYVDDRMGWDFINSDNNPTDDHGHGTNIAGIIGAKSNNALGVTGIDWNCKLMILKATDNTNTGTFQALTDAVNYAVNNGARVINMSMAAPVTATNLQMAIVNAAFKNVVVVASMGNYDSFGLTNYPAGYPGVIAVGSTDPDDTRSDPFSWGNNSQSNTGSYISVVAPGNYIYGLDWQSNTDYSQYWSGTSQAAPHVSGIASLLLAQNPSLTNPQVKTIIQNTAEDQVGDLSEDTPGWDKYYGYGRVNAYKALQMAAGVRNYHAENNWSVYPNPSSGTFYINSSKTIDEITVIDLAGRKAVQLHPSANNCPLNLETPGIYFLRVTSGKEISTQKLVVTH